MGKTAMSAVAGAALLAVTGCSVISAMRKEAGYVEKQKGFDFSTAASNPQSLADSYVGIDSRRPAQVKKVFIWSFRTKFLTQQGHQATGGLLSSGSGAKVKVKVRLKGIETVDFQAMTDQMYQQLVAELQAQGYEVVSPEELTKTAGYQEAMSDMHADQVFSNEDNVIVSPRGVKLVKQAGDPGVGAFAAAKIPGRLHNALVKIKNEIGAYPVTATVEVPFVHFAGTKGIFKLGSSAQVQWVAQLSLGGSLELTSDFAEGKMTSGYGFAKAYLKDLIVSEAEFGELQKAKVGLFKGEPPSCLAKPDLYKAEVGKAFGAASKLMAMKVKQTLENK